MIFLELIPKKSIFLWIIVDYWGNTIFTDVQWNVVNYSSLLSMAITEYPADVEFLVAVAQAQAWDEIKHKLMQRVELIIE